MTEKNLEVLFQEAYRFLEDSGVHYFVIGGIASAVLGESRFTADLDVVIFLSDDKIGAFLDSAKAEGYQLVPKDALRHARESLSFALRKGSLHVDCLIGRTALEMEALTRRTRVSLGGIKVWFPTPEDFILIKLIAGRDKDWIDVKSVALRHKGRLDLNYLREWTQALLKSTKGLALRDQLERLIRETR